MKDNIPQDLLIVVGARHYSANIKFLISTDDKNSLKCDGTAKMQSRLRLIIGSSDTFRSSGQLSY